MMKKLLLIISLALAGFYIAPAPAHAQFDGCAPGFCSPASGFAASCAESTAFIARAPGLDVTHKTAYDGLICGLVTDGVWTKLDMLHIYATQDSTTAALSLVSATYNGTVHGSPTFTADRGFTGIQNDNATYIDTNFDATTAVAPNFTRNSAHISSWAVINSLAQNVPIMGRVVGAWNALIYTQFPDGNTYYFTNDTASINVANVNITGLFLGNRSSAVAVQGYRNSTSLVSSGAVASVAPGAGDILTLGVFNATIIGNGGQVASASIGGSLSPTDETNFYDRLRTYMTAVGVP